MSMTFEKALPGLEDNPLLLTIDFGGVNKKDVYAWWIFKQPFYGSRSHDRNTTYSPEIILGRR